MKKTILTLALTVVAAASTFAQGTVIFNNTTTTKLSTNSAVGGSATGLTTAWTSGSPLYYYALFSAAAGTTVDGNSNSVVQSSAGTLGTWVFNAGNSSSWTLQAYGTNTTGGRFLSSQANTDGSTSLSFAGGTSTAFIVLAWSANLGSNLSQLETALATQGTVGWLGESAIGTETPGIPGSTSPSGLFGTVSPAITPFSLGEVTIASVPEPGTMALAALGGASLLLFRRKK
jgi:hypothetical protein